VIVTARTMRLRAGTKVRRGSDLDTTSGDSIIFRANAPKKSPNSIFEL
jgi:hypothetical protein